MTTFIGNRNNNTLGNNTNNSGDDIFIGQGGNDTLNGGTGNDTAVYASLFRSSNDPLDGFTIGFGAGNWTITTPLDGTDTLNDIETLEDGATRILLVGNGGYTSLQQAVADARDGDTIIIANGTYTLTTTLTIDDSITIIGQSETGVIIDAIAVDSYGVLVNANDVSLSNLTILGPQAGTTPGDNFGLKVEPDTGNPDDRLTGFSATDITVAGSGRSEIDLNGVNGASLTRVTVDGQNAPTFGAGLAITDSANITITDLVTTGNTGMNSAGVALFSQNTFYNQQTTNIVFAGSFSHGEAVGIFAQDNSAALNLGSVTLPASYANNHGFQLQFGTGTATPVTVYFESESQLDAVLAALPPVQLAAATIQNPDGEWLVKAGMSIQLTVNVAAAGDTISIYPGTYTESGAPVGQPGNPGGLYINTADLTLRGVTAAGVPITDPAATLATIIAGRQNNFGANHWADAGADNLTLTGLHFKAGFETNNKVLEIWGDNVTITHNFVDRLDPNGGENFPVAIYLNGDGTEDSISRYTITGNRLNEGIVASNGIGVATDGVATDQVIADNVFLDGYDYDTGLGRYDAIVLNGQQPGVPFRLESVQIPTITGNDFGDGVTPFVLRGVEQDPDLASSLAEVEAILAANTVRRYTYVIAAETGDLRYAESDFEGAPFVRFAVTNTLDTLNFALDSTPDNVFFDSAPRDYIHAGDTVVIQSGAAALDSTVMVNDLTIRAEQGSADLDLTLATQFADRSAIAGGGVVEVTLADFAPGLGANVDVTGNGLANIITGNSGANVLAGAGGNDSLGGGAGADVLQGGADSDVLDGGAGNDSLDGGAGIDTTLYTEVATITSAPGGWTVTTTAGGTDSLTGVEIVDDAATGRTLLVGNGGFATIQAAVDAAQDGDTILIASGTYTEQVVIDGKSDLTITEADGAAVTILAPTSVAQTTTSGSGRPLFAVVTVVNSTGVTIDGVTVDGAGAGNSVTQPGPGESNFVGVVYRNASGALTDVDITGVRDAYPGGNTLDGLPVQSGNQRGVGLQVDNNTLLDFTMTGGSITDFQKNATVFNRANLDISGVTVTGGGAQTINAQNGIQALNSTGTISGNTITAIGFAGAAEAYSGAILAFGNTDLDITDNTIVGSNGATAAAKVVGVFIFDIGTPNSGGTIDGNAISFVDTGIGIYDGVTPDQIVIGAGNTFTNLDTTDPFFATIEYLPTATLATIFDITGSEGLDNLSGAASGDTLNGAGGDDFLNGQGGNDSLNGGLGNDSIDGGAGSDTLVLSGNRADYTFTGSLATGVTVTGADGVDRVIRVENVAFDDFTQSLDSLVNNTAPSDIDFTGAVDENAAPGTEVGTATATDANTGGGDTLTFSFGPGGNPGGLFAINASTGVVTLVGSVDAETALGHEITIRVTDAGGLSHDETFTVAVNDLDEFGVSTPDDIDPEAGSSEANVVAEDLSSGSPIGITAFAKDEDATNNTVTYSLIGDTDINLFAINSDTGVVMLIGELDAETATEHTITVQAESSDRSVAFEDFTLTVTDVDDNDVTAPQDVNTAADTVAENAAIGTQVGITARSTDADITPAFRTVSYSLFDAADGLFAINASTGVVTVAGAVDFEAGETRSIIVRATGSNGAFEDTSFDIAITDVNEAPVIETNGGGATAAVDVAEGETLVTTVVVDDPDALATATFTLSGADANLFTIDAFGQLDFVTAPNFETPGDLGGNNIYEVTVTVSDGSLSDTQAISVTVTNVNEAPVIGGGDTAAFDVAENQTAVTTITALDPDLGATVAFTLSGADAALFTINAAGQLAFASSPNFEAPGDVGGNNVYNVTVTASDGSLTDSQDVAITVTNVNEAPTITSNGAGATAAINAAENQTAVTTNTALDPDAATTLTWSLAGGADQSRFTINAATGVLTFVTAPNFEAPTDLGGNNIYDVVVRVSDGTLTDTQALAVTVTDAAEAVTFNLTNNNDTFNQAGSNNALLVLGLDGNDTITTGNAADSVIGGAGNDVISSGAGDDRISYAGTNNGADTVDGGAGADDRIEAIGGNNVVIGLAAFSNIETITSNGFSGVRIAASSGNDTLNFTGVALDGIVAIDGGLGNDTITGSSVADTILGGRGDDVLSGGDGNDVFELNVLPGIDTISGGAGLDTIRAAASGLILSWNNTSGAAIVTGIESINSGGFSGLRIAGSGSADTIDLTGITLTGVSLIDGGSGGDTITGSSANDTIVGGTGNDVLRGGDGNDVFQLVTAAGNDSVDGGTGTDRIQVTTNNVQIGWGNFASVEQISGTGFTGTQILGTASTDVINLTGITLTDITRIDGGSGNDTIIGSAGADTLVGSSGLDRLTGGAGADVFDFNAVSDSRTTTVDFITDFQIGIDRIDLATIDANASTTANDAFSFIGSATITGVAQIRVDTTSVADVTIITGNSVGNTAPEFEIRLNGTLALTAADFIL